MPESEIINLNANLGWRHNYGDLDTSSTMRFTGGAQGFSVSGNNVARDSALLGVGGAINLDDTSKLYVGYDGNYSEWDRSHVLSLGLKIKF